MHRYINLYHVQIMEIHGYVLCQLYESTTFNKYEQEIKIKYMRVGNKPPP